MIILGSTGSIGVNALHIAQEFGIQIEMLSAGSNITLLSQQIKQFQPRIVVIKDSTHIPALQSQHKNVEYFDSGESGLLRALEHTHSPLALNAIVGFAGLKPTLKILEMGKTLALANKESLVIGGQWVDVSRIIPVDSEHFSLYYLQHNQPFRELILTASGGALRDTPIEYLHSQNAKEALKHPNWAMGKKITIDSATMMNKIFEVLEAFWLFKTSHIHAFIERNSIVHALVGFYDGSFTAHIAKNDMRLPIAYAMLGKKALQTPCNQAKELFKPINLCSLNAFKFEEIDIQRYPLWSLKDTLLKKPSLGVVVNAANEVAVEKFLNHQICFGEIESYIQRAIQHFPDGALTFDEIEYLDSEVRTFLSYSS
ncbi:1-deoxy-D-xylulose-5-phosphate reductoisomerase [Helicobacter monodelphidis]|uniref:1-deoxy-D-xylulose-5-phosphate reductoisomerase n=1 Tax=Helicobacter sp. 15-1451 TaxID=2004995 RepID=UPI000DCC3918|nr:1-deoxy-D-xylulose-5-phosphate reductoisomerase [Helicobacter sp. 15-1451]RAX57624.1 1-deoxy-D-xylulose-5-phosphate reductoisomerase [Helicobacter sp. 15-1451]